MVPKTKGASGHLHLISEEHLMEELRRLNLRRRSWVQKGLGTGQEDAEAGTLEDYATVFPFELL